ncbi:MAG: sigma-70 family RNA polymerase sigma factor [Planctomycetes bacterium]|nr:sigma-70 family RNA polymerase sigma factor [Planctomycetota bacterium]
MTREEQLTSLMNRHQADVWRYLRMLGCEPAQADDLTQDVFLYVLDHPFTDLGPAATGTYLRKCARHLFLNTLKRERRMLPFGCEEEAEAAWEAATPDGDSDERLERLARCLEKLEGRSRQAIELRYRDEAAEAQVAAALGTTLEAAKALLKRVRARLRECVERQVAP